jgi:hypothetical protein
MGVDVSVAALRESSRAHKAAAESLSSDVATIAALLLFYSVECGLKAALLRRSGARDTSSLTGSERSHDLRGLSKALRLSPSLASRPYYRLRDSQDAHNVTVAVHELHEAWRYGRKLQASDQAAAVADLHKMLNWCTTELGR